MRQDIEIQAANLIHTLRGSPIEDGQTLLKNALEGRFKDGFNSAMRIAAERLKPILKNEFSEIDEKMASLGRYFENLQI